MKIKKFVAPDIRRAIRMVREEQGPDAVILSNRRVQGGVEIVSAIDYDEALFKASNPAPEEEVSPPQSMDENPVVDQKLSAGAYSNLQQAEPPKKEVPAIVHEMEMQPRESALSEVREELRYLRSVVETRFFDLEWANYSNANPVNAELVNHLLKLGISSKLAREIAKDIPHTSKFEEAWEVALTRLGERIDIANDDIIDEGGIVALVGPTGVGKTTTVAKLAARYALRRGVRHVALITTDNYRVGAHEQLRTYGRLLDIPMRSAANKDELQAQIDDLADKDLILIDTAGMSQRDMRISEQLSFLKGSIANIKVYLVLAATGQLAGLEEVIDVFRDIELDGCIVTKLDEATSMGPAVSAIIEKGMPVAYISDGQRVPEDLHLARVDKLINGENFDMGKSEDKSAEEMVRLVMGRTAKNAH